MGAWQNSQVPTDASSQSVHSRGGCSAGSAVLRDQGGGEPGPPSRMAGRRLGRAQCLAHPCPRLCFGRARALRPERSSAQDTGSRSPGHREYDFRGLRHALNHRPQQIPILPQQLFDFLADVRILLARHGLLPSRRARPTLQEILWLTVLQKALNTILSPEAGWSGSLGHAERALGSGAGVAVEPVASRFREAILARLAPSKSRKSQRNRHEGQHIL